MSRPLPLLFILLLSLPDDIRPGNGKRFVHSQGGVFVDR